MRKRDVTPEYEAWRGMKQRCLNLKHKNYLSYGGRGIMIHYSWMNFEEFFKDTGERPGPEYSLDRIDNNWDYEPGNCRWATSKEQARNRRDNRLVQEDVDHIRSAPAIISVKMLAELYSVSVQTVYNVLNGTRWAGVV